MRPVFVPGIRPPTRAFYFYTLDDQARITAFYVANYDDTPTDEYPDGQFVESVLADGTRVRWTKREGEDVLVFHPPDPSLGGVNVGWSYDRRVQTGAVAPREILERYAVGSRVSA